MFQFSTLVPHSNVHVFAFVCRFIYRQNYYPKCAISHPTIEVDSEVCPVLNWKILPGLINAHSVVSRCHLNQLNQSEQHLFGWHTELVLLKGNDYEGYPFLGKLYIVLNCIWISLQKTLFSEVNTVEICLYLPQTTDSSHTTSLGIRDTRAVAFIPWKPRPPTVATIFVRILGVFVIPRCVFQIWLWQFLVFAIRNAGICI